MIKAGICELYSRVLDEEQRGKNQEAALEAVFGKNLDDEDFVKFQAVLKILDADEAVISDEVPPPPPPVKDRDQLRLRISSGRRKKSQSQGPHRLHPDDPGFIDLRKRQAGDR